MYLDRIPRELNQWADDNSKMADRDDWSVTVSAWCRIWPAFGPFGCDRFVSTTNRLLPEFCAIVQSPGILFVEDIFAQHLVHKTALTIVAWILFSILLWGRYKLGWRSQTAVRFTLAGFALLMLAYFGSKLVLELVLQRT